ncbi:MAG: hypothetical protein V1723_00330 [Candidatus Uhrbacteria bacterium]
MSADVYADQRGCHRSHSAVDIAAIADAEDDDLVTMHIEERSPISYTEPMCPDSRICQRLRKNEWIVRMNEPLELRDDTTLRRRIEGAEIPASAR